MITNNAMQLKAIVKNKAVEKKIPYNWLCRII